MKIVCKMTTVLACCQTYRQKDREGGRRKRKAETDKERKRLTKQHNVCHACSSARESSHGSTCIRISVYVQYTLMWTSVLILQLLLSV